MQAALVHTFAVLMIGMILPSWSSAGTRSVGESFASRSVVYAAQGAVATTNPLATGVALDVLRRGGTAIDAAIAAHAVIGVTEPFNTGVGGDLFAIVWDPKTKRLHGFNGSGRAPAGMSLRELQKRLGEEAREMPYFGYYTVSVPGAVDGWYRLHERFGRASMKELLAPAIAYADAGFPVGQVAADDWKSLDTPTEDPGEYDNVRAVFTVKGRTPRAGEVMRNPQLARVMEQVAAEGPAAFYRGSIARQIDAYMRRIGGPLRAEDLARHRGEWVDPVSVRYRGYDVFELRPNTQGAVVLETLRILEGYDLKAMGFGSADYAHVLVEAIKLAFEDRADFYADPRFQPAPLERLLSQEHADRQRALIEMQHARPTRGIIPKQSHTTYLTVADRDGMMVSFIASLFDAFGSRQVPDGLGFALQSRASGLSLVDGHPNVYAPNKRPFHTLIPAFVMKDGQPWLSFGVLGGSLQPQMHVQILVNMIDFGMNAQEAGDAARIAVSGGPEPWIPQSTEQHTVLLEPGLSAATVAELKRRGHAVEQRSGFFGGYQAIRRDLGSGVYEAASEMRMDGMAAGY